MQCAVCGRNDGEQFRHYYSGLIKNIRVKNYHVIPPRWDAHGVSKLEELKKLTVPLCQRCHDCCPPMVIAYYNEKLSYEVARVLTNLFPNLQFEVATHCCGDPKCSIHGRLTMDIIPKNWQK